MTLVQLTLAVVASTYVSLVLHEGLHYIVARRFTNDVCIGISYLVIPDYTYFERPEEVSDAGIRSASAAPLLNAVLLIPYVAIAHPVSNFLELWVLITLSLTVLASFISPPDLLGICYPDAYRELAERDSKMGARQALRRFVYEVY